MLTLYYTSSRFRKPNLSGLFNLVFIPTLVLSLILFLSTTNVYSAKNDFVVVNLGDNLAFNPTATDPDGDNLVFSYSGWMTSSQYVTRLGDTGTHTVTVTVSDGSLTDSRDVTVNVNYLSQVTLTWDPNTEADLAGYKLHIGTSSGSYDTDVDVGNQNYYTLSSLVSGQIYYISVTAYDSTGNESTNSGEIIYTVPIFSDSDGDGAPDSQDAFPNDPSRVV